MRSTLLAHVPLLALLLLRVAADSPVAKVIKLLEDLKKEVETDGKKEATSYGKFACFCKDTTKDKSKSITDGADKIGELSGSIAEDTASKEAKEAEVKERQETQEKLGSELTDSVTRCTTAKATYERSSADTEKALASLKKAIKAMKAAKDKAAKAKLMQVDKDVKRSMAIANAMGKLDPSDPAYKYHSQEINKILDNLLQTFKDDKKQTEDDFGNTQKACTEEQDGLAKKMKDNMEAIDKAKEKIASLKKKISKDRGDLIETQDTLAEDEKYLKELTATCEEKATDFDQRSQMRGGEIQALSTALKILGGKPKENEVVDKKALLQKISLIQIAQPKAVFLAKASISETMKVQNVLSLLRREGEKLSSPIISALVMRVAAVPHDPFKNAKKLIQKLIERLLEEGHAEAAKKGFCDEEIGKANKARDYAYAESKVLNAEMKELEAKKEELKAEMKELAKGIKKTEEKLKEATELRDKEKEENMEAIKKAKEGLDAVNEAILTLKAFYSSAARARVLLQVQADPKAGFGGAYKGKQDSSEAIFELLQTIADNFQSAMDKTQASEDKAAAEYVEFDRTSKEDISSKETKTTLDKQDLKSTDSAIDKGLDDLKTQDGLMEDALKMLVELKPACMDGGMNYKEREEKREQEIAALNKALEILKDA